MRKILTFLWQELSRYHLEYLWGFLSLAIFITYPTQIEPLKIIQPIRSTPFALEPLPPYPSQEVEPTLALSASSFASLDVASGKFLLSKDADKKVAPASTSKLLLSYEVRQRCPMGMVIEIKSSYREGSILGLVPGDLMTVESLLYATLLPSANDAAVALAEGCFGTVHSAVAAMNARALSWHLNSSNFTNPTGLDQSGNYTSASDLARLAALSTEDEVISKIVKTSFVRVSTTDGGKVYELISTNKLLGTNGIDGVKTGQTGLAGENLVASTKIEGHRIITVVLGSRDRFGETKKLIAEIGRIYSWQVEADWNFWSTTDSNAIK